MLARTRFPVWLRSLVAVIALAVALGGEALAEQARQGDQTAPPLASWLLFALGGVLLAVSAWPPPRVQPAKATLFIANLRKSRRALLLIPLALAILLNLAAIPLFVMLNGSFGTSDYVDNWLVNSGSWLLWALSLVCFGIAWFIWERSTPSASDAVTEPPGGLLPRRIELPLVIGLFVVALLLRVINLGVVPPGFWFDEGQNGLVARGLFDPGVIHPVFITDATQMGSLYFYFLGALMKVIGYFTWSERLLPALGGTLTIPMIYFLAARLYGWRTGITAAALLAVSSWNITFSRFGMVSMFTVFLDVAVYLCAAQGVRTGRLGYFAGAGVLLGVALQGYYVARLVPVVLVVLLLHLLITEWRRVNLLVRSAAPALLVGALLAIMPMALFAVQRPTDFNSRVDTVSIFSQEGSGGDPNALIDSITKHALMFNFLGDNNGRHNLPGQPMLDFITAALFFSGLVFCLLRFWRWQYFLPLIWFVAAMSGGVLSLLFEAPQAHRTLEASVVIPLICGIFLGELWRLLEGIGVPMRRAIARPIAAAAPPPTTSIPNVTTSLPVRQKVQAVVAQAVDAANTPPAEEAPVPVAKSRSRAAALVAAGIVSVIVVVAGVMSVNRYFNIQANNRQVWSDMKADQNAVTQAELAANGKADLYPGQFFIGLNETRLFDPTIVETEWTGMHMLPLDDNGRDAIVMFDPSQGNDLAAIAQLYPNATFTPVEVPSDPSGDPLEWTIKIPASDLAAVYGVRATFNQPGQQTQTKTVSTMDLTAADFVAGYHTVKLESTLKVADYSSYAFDWQGPQGATLAVAVDGFALNADNKISTLGVGLHSLVMTATLATDMQDGDDDLELLAGAGGAQPIPIAKQELFNPALAQPHGLTATYHPGTDFSVAPNLVRVEPSVSYYFHHPPIPFPFATEWAGKIYIPESGNYIFSADQIRSATLLIDDQRVVDNPNPGKQSGLIQLTSGFHSIRFQYVSDSGSHVYLYWTPPGHSAAVIPSAFLWPTLGEYPDPAQTSGLPTLDQFDGRVVPANRLVGVALANEAPDLPAPADLPPAQATTTANDNTDNAQIILPTVQAEVELPKTDAGATSEPRDIAADASGNFYVASDIDGIIRKYGPSGDLLTSWGNTSPANKVFTELFGIAVGADGIVYALDAGQAKILRFDANGQPAGDAIDTGAYNPRGFSIAPNGYFLVANTGGHEILRIGPDGSKTSVLSQQGADPGQLNEPTDVVEGSDGFLYVLDSRNSRIQKLNADGSFVAQWAVDVGPTARDGGHIAIDSNNRIFVAMPGQRQIVVFDANGVSLVKWSERDLNPAGIYVDAQDNVYVTYPATGTARKYATPAGLTSRTPPP